MGARAALRADAPAEQAPEPDRRNVAYLKELLAYLERATMEQALAEYDRLPHEAAADDFLD